MLLSSKVIFRYRIRTNILEAWMLLNEISSWCQSACRWTCVSIKKPSCVQIVYNVYVSFGFDKETFFHQRVLVCLLKFCVQGLAKFIISFISVFVRITYRNMERKTKSRLPFALKENHCTLGIREIWQPTSCLNLLLAWLMKFVKTMMKIWVWFLTT